MTRLFVAVWPSDEARDYVRSLPRDRWVNVRWTAEDNWHVTLAFVGEAEIDDIAARLEGVALPSATAEVGLRMRVLGGGSVVVPVNGLDELAAAVRARVFEHMPKQSFRGHLTVGRSIGGRPISGKSMSGAASAPITFDVNEIALVRSTLSPQGARYDTVGTFACR